MKRARLIATSVVLTVTASADPEPKPAVASDNPVLDILEDNSEINEIVEGPLTPQEQANIEPPPPVFIPKEWESHPMMDDIWARAILFEDESNPYIQQIKLSGMLHAGAAWGTAEVEGQPSNVDLDTARVRRARLGASLKLYGNTEVEAVGEFAGDGNFPRIERLKGRTEVIPNYYVDYGKYRPRFGVEQSKDPQDLLTPERSLLANMLMPASSLGFHISQDTDTWDWGLGWFSSDFDQYIPGFQGSGFLVANLAYESAERTDSGEVFRTRWHADYIHNLDLEESETVPRYALAGRRSANGNQRIARNPAFRHLFSTGVDIEGDRFSFESDFQLAHGDMNAWGLTLTPSYWVVPGTLKVVGRYHYADTDEPGGLVGGLGFGNDPFFDSSPIFVGDEFHSFYLGANLHLYRDQMVLLNGVEYAMMKDDAGAGAETDAWIWHTGARFSF